RHDPCSRGKGRRATTGGGCVSYAACCLGHDARHIVTAVLVAFPRRLARRDRQSRDCTMFQRLTIDITSALQHGGQRHIVEGSSHASVGWSTSQGSARSA